MKILYMLIVISILRRLIPLIDEKLLDVVSAELKKQKLTVATAESCTGGLIAHSLTNIPGSSEYFERGVVSYSNKAKIDLLDVSEKLIKEHGAVSEQVAKAMAEAVREKSKADIGVSTTGIAGPSGGTEEKPVGLVYIAVSTSKDTKVKRFQFTGNRLQNKERTCNTVLWMLFDHLKK